MTHYEFRCLGCGSFEQSAAMGTAPAVVACPQCGEPAPRRFTAPLVRQVATPLGAALGRAECSREQPEVVHRA